MEGPEGIKNTGKSAKEATSTIARTGRPKAVASHCKIGRRTYKEINEIHHRSVQLSTSSQF